MNAHAELGIPVAVLPELLRRLRDRGCEPRVTGPGVYTAACPCCGGVLTIVVIKSGLPA